MIPLLRQWTESHPHERLSSDQVHGFADTLSIFVKHLFKNKIITEVVSCSMAFFYDFYDYITQRSADLLHCPLSSQAQGDPLQTLRMLFALRRRSLQN